MCRQSVLYFESVELTTITMSRTSYSLSSEGGSSQEEASTDLYGPISSSENATYEQLAHKLPYLLKEKQLKWGESDKIFTSEWLTESNVLVGTKCNKLYLVDTLAMSNSLCTEEIPTLANCKQPLVRHQSLGIHSVSASPLFKYLATSGSHPNDLAIYKLPELSPLRLGQAHSDWIFDIQWISEELIVTGSRDSTMALWSINQLHTHKQILADYTPILDPIFYFSNHPTPPADCGERVRSLAYHEDKFELGSLQTNPCGASIHFWDVYMFQQVYRYGLPFCAENVCLEASQKHSSLYAAGSRSHVTLVDSRTRCTEHAGSIRSPDKDCGVRSLNFNCNLLSIGTGAGNLYFYDIRAQSFLFEDETCQIKHALHTTPGWLLKDQTYRDFFSGLPQPPNAIYTHSYSPMRTKIFTAGGPLPLGLCGNYAAMWI